jgi:ABC-type arginine/histidine transport system permease subunit
MDIAAVMDEVAAQLATIADLNVTAHWRGSPNPPEAIVSLPRGDFDAAYARGMDRWELPVILVLGKVSERSARDAASPYVSGSGAKSFKAVLEAGTYTELDSLRVQDFEFDVVTFAAVDYLTVTFILDIAGQGA